MTPHAPHRASWPAIGLTLLAGWAVATSAAAEEPPRVRVVEVAKDHVTVAVSLDAPADVAVSWGEAPMAWTGRAEGEPLAREHRLRLGKLVPDRRYFYQLEIDGRPVGEILTVRCGRSWVVRRETVLVTADVPDGRAGEEALAARLFAEDADLVVALGGDGGQPEAFDQLHRRTLGERLVLETGGSRDAGLVVVGQADVAFALLGDATLAGETTTALAWAGPALDTVQGACWKVLASARSVAPEETAALAEIASGVGAQVVVAPGPTTGLHPHGDVAVLILSDPDRRGAGPRRHGRLAFVDGRLEAALVGPEGVVGEPVVLTRECPLPDLGIDFGSPGDFDDLGDAGSSDLDALPEDCDY